MTVLAQKEYKEIIERQDKLEAAFEAIRKIVDSEFDDERIKASALKKWEKISRELDSGKGTFFNSPEDARKWLKTLDNG